MFKVRLLSGIVLVIAAILLIVPGGAVLGMGLCIISVIGMYELYRTIGFEKSMPAIAGYCAAVLYYVLTMLGGGLYQVPLIYFVIFIMVIMAIYVFTFPKYDAGQIMCVFFGLIYVAVMLSYIYLTRQLSGGAYLVWLVFLGSWGCDTCAYCVGMLLGKHKLAPVLSPKKSIEGAVGGVVGAGLLGAIYGAVFSGRLALAIGAPVIKCALICIVGAVISQVGDLAASAIKRSHNVKDYGTLIPGHGGILDRFDSVIFVAPAIYFTIVVLTEGLGAFI